MRSRLNVFEGAKHLALLLAALWAIGVINIVYDQDSKIRLRYDFDSPITTPVKRSATSRHCDSPYDRWEWKDLHTAHGTSVWVDLCFKAGRSDTGRMLVPFTTEPNGRLEFGESYSLGVSSYSNRIKRDFRLPPADEEWADRQSRIQPLKKVGVGALWLIGGWVVLWIFTAIVGCLVRGTLVNRPLASMSDAGFPAKGDSDDQHS